MVTESLQPFVQALAACCIALLCWLGVLWCARRLAGHWFAADAPSVQWTAAAVLSLAWVVVLLEIVGTGGWLSAAIVAAACYALIVVASIVQSPARVHDDLHAAAVWLRERVRDGYGALFCLAAVLIAQAVLRGLRCPPLSWDSLTYHAFLPARWVQLGELAPFAAPGCMDTARAYPINLELLVAWVLLPFKTDLFVNMVNLPVMAWGAVAMYALARELGAAPRLAVWAPALFCFSPAIWALITTQYTDVLVASTIISGLLFLVRYTRTSCDRDLLFAAASFGLAVGTKYTAITLTGIVLLFLIGRTLVLRYGVALLRTRSVGPPRPTQNTKNSAHCELVRGAAPNPVRFSTERCGVKAPKTARPQTGRLLRRRAKLFSAVAIVAIATGGYQYIRNWIELGNPVYPYRAAIAGHVVFEDSPLTTEIIQTAPHGSRADDWRHLQYMFSAQPYGWGTKYILIAMAALAAPFLAPRRRFVRFLLLGVVLGGLLSFYGPDGGIAATARRMFIESTPRYLSASMAAAACLATAALAGGRWPRGLVAVVPTLAVLVDLWRGRFPQPLSYGESIVVVAVAVALLAVVTPQFSDRAIQLCNRWRLVTAGCLTALLLLFTAGTVLLQVKRELTRYVHYAHSIDYHSIQPGLAPGWQACDQPDRPQVVALVRRHCGDDVEGWVYASSRWFWYPLLGSRLQNKVVYASIHELRDLPSPSCYGWTAREGREDVWLENLRRLRVDSLFVMPGAYPEEGWIASRPDVFASIAEAEKCRVYRVRPTALSQAIAALHGSPEKLVLSDDDHHDR